MAKSYKRQRREAYFKFPDAKVREAIYSLGKSLQAQGIKIPQLTQDFVDHCDKVKSGIPKPKKE
tara:strand:- start:148 stop:339 length:192 start_codon:yes stop_codon:yes gene_type:complete